MYVIQSTNPNISHVKNSLTLFEWQDGEKKETNRFYIDDGEMTFLNNSDMEALTYVRDIVQVPYYKSTTRVKYTPSSLTPYDFQDETIKFLIARLKKDKAIHLSVNLPPGKGKTLIAGKTLTEYGKRFAIVILAGYIEKWISDCKTQFGVDPEDIFVVKGSDSLIKLMNMETKDIPNIVIFSNRTLLNAIKGKTSGKYSIELYELMEHMDMDTILIDELHQEFESQYNICTMLNPRHVLALSATLHSDTEFIEDRMLDFIKPYNRIAPLTDNKYRNIIGVGYNIGCFLNTRNYYTKNYSHATFEGSLMKKPKMLNEYLNMIEYYVNNYYIARSKDKGRLIIFAATKNMIKAINKRLEKKFRSSGYDIRQFMGGDPLANVLESDISISTVGSAGTAIDIENLTTVLFTVSMLSTNANEQVFGRLREIEGVELNFIYLFAKDNDVMVRHHGAKQRQLGPKAKNYNVTNYPKPLTTRRY